MRYEGIIHDRGRGPEIKGTRITVYSILDYVLDYWPPERIAHWFNISRDQVEAAIEYIREHQTEVLTNYIEILKRCERGNPPEVQAKIDASHKKFVEMREKLRDIKDRAQEDIRALIDGYRTMGAKGKVHAGDTAGQ